MVSTCPIRACVCRQYWDQANIMMAASPASAHRPSHQSATSAHRVASLVSITAMNGIACLLAAILFCLASVEVAGSTLTDASVSLEDGDSVFRGLLSETDPGHRGGQLTSTLRDDVGSSGLGLTLDETSALGRSLLRRRRKKKEDDDDDNDSDSEDSDSDSSDDEEEDDDDDGDDEDDEEDNDKGNSAKTKKTPKRRKVTKLLGVQLDMDVLVKSSEDTDEDDGEDDGDDDEDRRRRRLLATAAADAKEAPSAELSAYVTKVLSKIPEGILVLAAKLPRVEAETACGNVAGGKPTFNIDLKKVTEEAGLDDGDDITAVAIEHHKGCVVSEKGNVLISPSVKTDLIFLVAKVKDLLVIVECPAGGGATCNVFGTKAMLPPDAVEVPSSEAPPAAKPAGGTTSEKPAGGAASAKSSGGGTSAAGKSAPSATGTASAKKAAEVGGGRRRLSMIMDDDDSSSDDELMGRKKTTGKGKGSGSTSKSGVKSSGISTGPTVEQKKKEWEEKRRKEQQEYEEKKQASDSRMEAEYRKQVSSQLSDRKKADLQFAWDIKKAEGVDEQDLNGEGFADRFVVKKGANVGITSTKRYQTGEGTVVETTTGNFETNMDKVRLHIYRCSPDEYNKGICQPRTVEYKLDVKKLAKAGGGVPTDGWCFPAAAQVLLSNGTTAPMHQLRQGDRVLTVQPSGNLGFSEVYLFGHKDPEATANFVELRTHLNTSLLASPDHYIHIIPAGKAMAVASRALSWRDVVHIPAGKVQAGDVMVRVTWQEGCGAPPPGGISNLAARRCGGSMSYATVASTRRRIAKGLFNPYTLAGNIVVDGYSASSHSSMYGFDKLTGTGPAVPHLVQALLAPVRLLYRMYPSLVQHVDGLYSGNGWVTATTGSILRSIVDFVKPS